jgi:hypothetical protein
MSAIECIKYNDTYDHIPNSIRFKMYFTQHLYFISITAYLLHNFPLLFPLLTSSLKVATVDRNM